jgi:hypothetical protein
MLTHSDTLFSSLNDGEDRREAAIDKTYGSLEVLNVTITTERLYRVIRSANAAFFAGDVEKAYEVLKDALKLFKRLGNQKAIGVAVSGAICMENVESNQLNSCITIPRLFDSAIILGIPCWPPTEH